MFNFFVVSPSFGGGLYKRDAHVLHMCLSGVFCIRWSARGERAWVLGGCVGSIRLM